MESFKVTERESKLKAYSKKALSKAHQLKLKKKKLNSENPEKLATKNSLQEKLEMIVEQISLVDEEFEGVKEKHKKGQRELVERLERRLELMKTFQDKLSQVLQRLENDDISADDVNGLMEGIDNFIDNNDQPDFTFDEYFFEPILAEQPSDDEENDYEEGSEDFDVGETDSPILPPMTTTSTSFVDSTISSLSTTANKASNEPPPSTNTATTITSTSPTTNIPKQQFTVDIPAVQKKETVGIMEHQVTKSPTDPNKVSVVSNNGLASQQDGKLLSNTPKVVESSKATNAMKPSIVVADTKTSSTTNPKTALQSKTDVSKTNSIPSAVDITATAMAPSGTTNATGKPTVIMTPQPEPTAKKSTDGAYSQLSKKQRKKLEEEQRLQEILTQRMKQPSYSEMAAKGLEVSTASASTSSTSVQHNSAISSIKPMVTTSNQPSQQPTSSGPSSSWPRYVSIEDETNEETFGNGSISGMQGLGNLMDISMQTSSATGKALDTLSILQASMKNMPQLGDSEKPKVYQPLNPYQTPDSFPSKSYLLFNNPAIFEKMDVDCLFFIFYYQQGTVQQYLAAKELKKQAWRFHKKYSTWFQRHDQPKITTNEYELGTYVYFDYESDWCQRIKSGFRFEYEFLEDDLSVN